MTACKACGNEVANKYITRDGLCQWCEAERAEDYDRYLHTDLNPDGTPKLPLPRIEMDMTGWDPDRDWSHPVPLTGSMEEKLAEEAAWGEGPTYNEDEENDGA